MTSPEAVATCRVCGEATEAHTTSICGGCGMVFHLNSRTDLPGKDCGDVWVSEEHMALEFVCNVCLALQEAPAAPLDDVIDIVEAAQVAGMTEASLQEAADSGEIPAKRIAGTVLIFQRADVVRFAKSRR